MRKRMHRIRAGAVLAILVLAMAPASRAGDLFRKILRLIDDLRPRPAPA